MVKKRYADVIGAAIVVAKLATGETAGIIASRPSTSLGNH
jgi:hypothetical protein